MTVRRRTLLTAGAAGAGVLILPAGLAGCKGGWPVNQNQSSAGAVLPSKARLPKPFQVQLPIPPVLAPSHSDDAGDHYHITQRVGHVQILPGPRTTVWGYNGRFPGPTISARRGRPVLVHHHNHLSVPTVVHLHGGRTPPESDGYPTDYVIPVGGGWPTSVLHSPGRVHQSSFTYSYPLDQRAATLWYHDHRMDFTGPSIWRGLAGFFLIHDEEEEALRLPGRDRDIPLMIVDRSFAADGSLHYPSVDPSLRHTPGVTDQYMSGVLGDCILVNGAAWPVLNVANTRYRFRILNASNARRYRLTLDPQPDGPSFVQIGSGQGLLRSPHPLDAVDIAQAERFDVVVDFSAYPVGQQITLRNDYGDGNTALVMRFQVSRQAQDHSSIPSRLSNLATLHDSDVVAHRKFVFARGGATENGRAVWTINGKKFDPHRIDAQVRKGTTEHWTIRAKNLPHPFHIHEDGFQVINSNSGNDGSNGETVRPRYQRRDQPGQRRNRRTTHPFRRLPRHLRLPLPQPRTRRHDDDGQLPHQCLSRHSSGPGMASTTCDRRSRLTCRSGMITGQRWSAGRGRSPGRDRVRAGPSAHGPEPAGPNEARSI